MLSNFEFMNGAGSVRKMTLSPEDDVNAFSYHMTVIPYLAEFMNGSS